MAIVTKSRDMMKLSIRGKVCLGLTGFSLFCAISLGLITTSAFSKFYYQFKKDSMISVSQEISKVYEEQGTESYDDFDQISQSFGADIYIIENGELVYSSRPDRKVMMPPPEPPMVNANGNAAAGPKHGKTDEKSMMKMQPPRHVSEMMELLSGHEPDGKEMGKVRFNMIGNRFRVLDLVQRIQSHTYLIISQPVAPIEESVQIVKQFAWICGILWFVVAVVGALIWSNRLTRPLLRLKDQAVHMTALDFSKKWQGGREDEIGQLGNSLNRLSEQLDTAMTELKASNQQLHHQLDKANEVEHMRKQFISSVSHELKTPLAIIQGYAEGLDTIAPDEETRQRYCRIIRNETEKMDHLVRDLLNLSRLETGSFRIECTDFDFTALADETKERFAQSVTEKQIQVEWDLPSEMPVNGDPERIDQILGNFLSNAIDYTEAGKKIRIFAKEEAECYTISVYNQGIQIAPENQERLWTAFFKVDTARTRKFGGHGLGLSIVAALVTLHHQKYGMYNAPDGVVFWFTIAKAKPDDGDA
jgi:two-component system sensor histidine kinase VanS